MKSGIHLLDCTLRDGSYLIDYQFTAQDTFIISKAIARTGISHIEVGHGLGLDAQTRGKGTAAEDDIRYISAAVSAVEGISKVGVFFIPGIGKIDSIKKAADAGLNFIRIGTNILESEQAIEAIAISKNLGLEVSSNLMKSYSVPPEEFADRCRMVKEYGADIVCLVDSAGGMTPNEVREYLRAAKAVSDLCLGFHGHDNLHLAIANCLAAAEEGAVFLDASLRGMGRSAGNAATEVLASLLIREGKNLGNIDWQMLIRLAEELIGPLMPRDTGLKAVELASGLAYFHSSFQGLVNKASQKQNVSPHETILNIGSAGKAGITEDIATQAAVQAAARKNAPAQRSASPTATWSWRSDSPVSIPELWAAMNEFSAKTGFQPVLTIARSRLENPAPLRVTPVRTGNGFCIGHIESAGPAEDMEIFRPSTQELPKRLLVDLPITLPDNLPEDIQVVRYDDDLLTLRSLLDLILTQSWIKSYYLPGASQDRAGKNLFSLSLNRFLVPVKSNADIGIAYDRENRFMVEDVLCIRPGGTLLVAQQTAVNPTAVERARALKINVCRLDLSECLISEVSRLFNTFERIRTHAGQLMIDDIEFVAGGILGSRGGIVVNSITKPTAIVGVADGIGGVLPFRNIDKERQEKVLRYISDRVDF